MVDRRSRDRVEFQPITYCTDSYRGTSSMWTSTRKALVKAMGLDVTQATEVMDQRKTIRCRPSQFARFMIYRSEAGAKSNSFKALKARLVPSEERDYLDVSGNPA